MRVNLITQMKRFVHLAANILQYRTQAPKPCLRILGYDIVDCYYTPAQFRLFSVHSNESIYCYYYGLVYRTTCCVCV